MPCLSCCVGGPAHVVSLLMKHPLNSTADWSLGTAQEFVGFLDACKIFLVRFRSNFWIGFGITRVFLQQHIPLLRRSGLVSLTVASVRPLV